MNYEIFLAIGMFTAIVLALVLIDQLCLRLCASFQMK